MRLPGIPLGIRRVGHVWRSVRRRPVRGVPGAAPSRPRKPRTARSGRFCPKTGMDLEAAPIGLAVFPVVQQDILMHLPGAQGAPDPAQGNGVRPGPLQTPRRGADQRRQIAPDHGRESVIGMHDCRAGRVEIRVGQDERGMRARGGQRKRVRRSSCPPVFAPAA